MAKKFPQKRSKNVAESAAGKGKNGEKRVKSTENTLGDASESTGTASSPSSDELTNFQQIMNELKVRSREKRERKKKDVVRKFRLGVRLIEETLQGELKTAENVMMQAYATKLAHLDRLLTQQQDIDGRILSLRFFRSLH